MVVVTGIAFYISLRRREHKNELKIIRIYIFFSLLFDFISFFLDFFAIPRNVGARIENISLNIFLLTEFSLLNYFLLNNISGKGKKITVTVICFIFLIYFSSYWLNSKVALYHFVPQIAVIESICLIIPSLLFFFDLFDYSKNLKLNNYAPFWIATGVLFYNSCSIPLFLLFPYFQTTMPIYLNTAFALNYILYTFLFILFIRAFLCKTS
jgi:hypothetical protein